LRRLRDRGARSFTLYVFGKCARDVGDYGTVVGTHFSFHKVLGKFETAGLQPDQGPKLVTDAVGGVDWRIV
jgi:hypothetical protein